MATIKPLVPYNLKVVETNPNPESYTAPQVNTTLPCSQLTVIVCA